MKKNFQKQFETMRDVIQSNITTIKALVEQSKQLSDIIEEMTGKDENCAISEQLIKVRDDISSQLDNLIAQTLNLHESYKELIDKVFKD